MTRTLASVWRPQSPQGATEIIATKRTGTRTGTRPTVDDGPREGRLQVAAAGGAPERGGPGRCLWIEIRVQARVGRFDRVGEGGGCGGRAGVHPEEVAHVDAEPRHVEGELALLPGGARGWVKRRIDGAIAEAAAVSVKVWVFVKTDSFLSSEIGTSSPTLSICQPELLRQITICNGHSKQGTKQLSGPEPRPAPYARCILQFATGVEL